MNAFEGLTVLDFSQGITGPLCATVFGRQGVQVIKREPPRGDWIGHAGAGRLKQGESGWLKAQAAKPR